MTVEGRWLAYGSRWGPGKVHRYLYDTTNRLWFVACQRPGSGDPHGRRLTNNEATVTCRKCQPTPDVVELEDPL